MGQQCFQHIEVMDGFRADVRHRGDDCRNGIQTLKLLNNTSISARLMNDWSPCTLNTAVCSATGGTYLQKSAINWLATDAMRSLPELEDSAVINTGNPQLSAKV